MTDQEFSQGCMNLVQQQCQLGELREQAAGLEATSKPLAKQLFQEAVRRQQEQQKAEKESKGD